MVFRHQIIALLLSLPILVGPTACTDDSPSPKPGGLSTANVVKPADTKYALFVYQNKLSEKLGIGEEERKEIAILAELYRNVVEVENGGPKKKFATIPFEILRQPGEEPEAFINRKWAWFGSRVRSHLSEEQRKQFENMVSGSELEAPSIKTHPRGQGYILMWNAGVGESSTVTNIPGAIADIDDALAALRIDDGKRQREAMDWLAGIKINPDRRTEVIASLKDKMHGGSFLVQHAVPAFERWTTIDDNKFIHSMLDMRGDEPRNAAVRLLVKFKDKNFTDAILKRIDVHYFRSDAMKTLKKLGTEAEQVTIGLLSEKNQHNGIVFHTLGHIGGQKSLDAINRLKHLDQGAAKDAIRRIEERIERTNRP